jgi:hypothetical protein
MSHISSVWRRRLTFLLPGALIITLAALPGMFTLARNQKAKKPALKEAVIREGPNLVRAMPGFEIIKDAPSSAVVRSKGDGAVVGAIRCAVCPGSTCATVIFDDGRVMCATSRPCVPGSCFINPF